jgi:hypothetical protein
MSSDLVMRVEVLEKQVAIILNARAQTKEDKFIQKINSQEKEIEFLKKNALAQEIKINDNESLLNKWMIKMSDMENVLVREVKTRGLVREIRTDMAKMLVCKANAQVRHPEMAKTSLSTTKHGKFLDMVNNKEKADKIHKLLCQ